MWPTTSASSLEAPDTTEEDSLRLTTINTNEHEVANGFVKNGSSLPYVYETNDSGKSYFSLVTSFKLSSSRKSKEILQDDSHLRDMWKEVCLRDNNETALGNAHWRKALLVQGLRQAVYAERESQGKCQTLHIALSKILL